MAESSGTLVIADRAVARIAEQAAVGVDGVVRVAGVVDSAIGSAATDLLGISGDLPHADVDAVGTARRLSLAVALAWPCPVTTVCQSIRRNVGDDVERLTGDRPLRVDVTVRKLVPRGEVVRHRRGYIDLPPVIASESADTAEDAHDDE